MTPETFQAYKDAVRNGNQSAAKRLLGQLVAESEHLVARHAKKLAQGDFDDLMQVGRMALVKAIETCNPERGSLAAYAKKKIVTEMQRQVVGPRAQVSSSAQWRPMLKRTRRAYQAFEAKNGHPPTAVDLGVDPEAFESWTQEATFAPYEESPPDNEECSTEAAVAAATTDISEFFSRGMLRAMARLSSKEKSVLLERVLEDESFGFIGYNKDFSKQRARAVFELAITTMRSALLSKGE